MEAQLTVLIPCKDERLNIRACIESARKVADEVLVADSGSSDETRDIAGSLGVRVIERDFIGYSDFKNWAIPQAKHAWVLIVDADERVSPALRSEIDYVRALHDREALLPRERQRRFLAGDGWVGWSGPAIAEAIQQVSEARYMNGGLGYGDRAAGLADLVGHVVPSRVAAAGPRSRRHQG